MCVVHVAVTEFKQVNFWYHKRQYAMKIFVAEAQKQFWKAEDYCVFVGRTDRVTTTTYIDVNDDDGEYLSRSAVGNTVVHPALDYRLAISLFHRLVLRVTAAIRGLHWRVWVSLRGTADCCSAAVHVCRQHGSDEGMWRLTALSVICSRCSSTIHSSVP